MAWPSHCRSVGSAPERLGSEAAAERGDSPASLHPPMGWPWSSQARGASTPHPGALFPESSLTSRGAAGHLLPDLELWMSADCPLSQLWAWPRQDRQEGGLARAPFRPGTRCPCSDGVHELVDQTLGDVGLADDALLVILADGAAQLVVVHGGAVLADAPQSGHLRGVLDFEDAWGSGGPGESQQSRGERDQDQQISLAESGEAGSPRGQARLWGHKTVYHGC